MSVRYLCDICDSEVTLSQCGTQPEFAAMVTHPHGLASVQIKIQRQVDGKAWNAGHICYECLGKAFGYLAELLPSVAGPAK